MSLTEFNEKEYIDLIRQEEAEINLEKGFGIGRGIGREEGREEGIELGQNLLSSLIDLLFEKGRIENVRRVTKDPLYRDQLLKEYTLI